MTDRTRFHRPPVALFALLFLAPVSTLFAQAGQQGPSLVFGGDHSPRGVAHRTIVGHVTGDDGKPAIGAMVFLKEANTKTVRTMSVDANGDYRFGPLPLTVDYQLWAEEDGRKTAIKPISSFIETNFLSIPLRFEQAAATQPAEALPPTAH